MGPCEDSLGRLREHRKCALPPPFGVKGLLRFEGWLDTEDGRKGGAEPAIKEMRGLS